MSSIDTRFDTVTPLSKGIALTLFVLLPVLGFYLGMHFQHSYDTVILENKCSGVRLSKNRTQSPAVLTPTPSPSPRIQTGVFTQTSDLVVVADIDASTDIVATLPEGSTVNYDTESGFMRATVTIDSQSYRFIAEAGGRGSSCPNNCWSEDIPLQLNSGSTTSLRIWQESSGVFMLNPWSIPIDSYDINHLEITKTNNIDFFTPEEITLWNDIIKTIRSNHYQTETLDLNNLKDNCTVQSTCGDLVGVDCGSAADGPYYYVNKNTEEIVEYCGGYCFAPERGGTYCRNCPPADWTCSVY